MFFPTLVLAASMRLAGMPGSGIGIPIHSLWGFGMGLYFLLKSPGVFGGVRFGSNLRRLNHQIPYLLPGSKGAAALGETQPLISSNEWGL